VRCGVQRDHGQGRVPHHSHHRLLRLAHVHPPGRWVGHAHVQLTLSECCTRTCDSLRWAVLACCSLPGQLHACYSLPGHATNCQGMLPVARAVHAACCQGSPCCPLSGQSMLLVARAVHAACCQGSPCYLLPGQSMLLVARAGQPGCPQGHTSHPRSLPASRQVGGACSSVTAARVNMHQA